MIIGIGLDMVEIDRFANWHTLPVEQLARFFTAQEIEYCLTTPIKSAERFAVRFAAKEAFFKALSCAAPNNNIPLLTVCRAVGVERAAGTAPTLAIDWKMLEQYSQAKLPAATAHVSLSHTKSLATAYVILQNNYCQHQMDYELKK